MILFALVNVVFLLAQISNISANDSQISGRLLTPEEGCGTMKATSTKIVGGTEAKPGAFPWMALIGYGERSFSCGGSLITSRHVLTAAHCLAPNLTFVRLGEHDLNMTSEAHQDIKVIRATKHPDFGIEYKFANDIAILTLERDLEFNDRIQPICLPLRNEVQNKFLVGTNPFVAGWGRLMERGARSNVLMQVQIPVIENSKCEELFRKINKLFTINQFNEAVFCGGDLAGGQNACHGDSGGPSMLPILENGEFTMYQIGVVSYGKGCARADIPGVYTRVSHFMDWIISEVSQN